MKRVVIDRDAARKVILCATAKFTILWISEQRKLGRKQADIAHEIFEAQADVQLIVEKATDDLAMQLYTDELNAGEAEFEADIDAASRRGALSHYGQTWLN